MADEATLPRDLTAFLDRHFDNIESLEILVLMQRDGTRSWSVEQLAAELRTSTMSVTPCVARLQSAGFLQPDGVGFLYAPRSHELEVGARHAIDAYRERRVAVITHIFSKPDPIRQFADAFKIKKED
jgi:hypothetical protein